MKIEYTGRVHGDDSDIQRALEAARESLTASGFEESEAYSAYLACQDGTAIPLQFGAAEAWKDADYAARVAYTEGWEDPSWDGITLVS